MSSFIQFSAEYTRSEDSLVWVENMGRAIDSPHGFRLRSQSGLGDLDARPGLGQKADVLMKFWPKTVPWSTVWTVAVAAGAFLEDLHDFMLSVDSVSSTPFKQRPSRPAKACCIILPSQGRWPPVQRSVCRSWCPSRRNGFCGRWQVVHGCWCPLLDDFDHFYGDNADFGVYA